MLLKKFLALPEQEQKEEWHRLVMQDFLVRGLGESLCNFAGTSIALDKVQNAAGKPAADLLRKKYNQEPYWKKSFIYYDKRSLP